MASTPIPRELSKPQQLLFLTIDELVPFGLGFVIGIASGWFFTCVALGVAGSVFFRRYRDSRPDGFLLHLLYWYGLAPIKGRSVINPFHRRVLPA